ncbi:YbhN family protein [Sphingomonas sp. MMS24-J13]|uniref:lysylphosphatidylglycerol synthase transmembrane domain-containing protein n=1 Tax=Sphingomonas sp. MMS24-J13 TaxID=3238686 RepID=UPI003850389A
MFLTLVGLVVVVLRAADFEGFIRTIRRAQPAWFVAALALQITTYCNVAMGWRAVLRAAGVSLPFAGLIRIALSKLFADQVLPGAGMGGNIVLVDRLTALGCPRGAAMAALLVSMVGYYAAYALLALIMLLVLALRHKATPVLAVLVLIFLVVALILPGAALWLRSKGSRPLPRRLERIGAIARLVHVIGEAPRDLIGRPGLIAQAALFNGLVFLADAATLGFCLKALGHPVPLSTMFVAVISASIAVTLAPLPLGLGSFEASCTGMLSLLGVPLAVAFAGTLLLRSLTLWLPLIPGLVLFRGFVFSRRGRGRRA